MKEDKPNLIRIIGIVLSIISVIMLLTNVMGLFMLDHLAEGPIGIEGISHNQAFDYAIPLAVLSIILNSGLLIAGIFIMRYENWARVLAQVIAILFFIYIWIEAVFIAGNNPFDKGAFTMAQLIAAFIWSIPIIMLVKYFNKENIKNYFV